MSNTSQSLPVGEEIFLLKMGEMVLKGLNRRSFEDKLIGNRPPPAGAIRQVPHLLPPVHHLRGAQGGRL